jgi:hypothetical protein
MNKAASLAKTFSTSWPTGVYYAHPELVGKLHLHESLATKPIAIRDEAIGRRKMWREISMFVSQIVSSIQNKVASDE